MGYFLVNGMQPPPPPFRSQDFFFFPEMFRLKQNRFLEFYFIFNSSKKVMGFCLENCVDKKIHSMILIKKNSE